MRFINGIKKRLGAKGSFLANVITMMTGTAFAQVIAFFAAPVLTRLFEPASFGLLALFMSITGIISIVACLRYELAIVLPKEDEEAANVLALAIFVCIFMALFVLGLVVLFGEKIAHQLKAPEIAPWLWLVPISILVIGSYQAMNYWSTRKKHFKRLAISRVSLNTTIATSQIGSGMIQSLSFVGLIGGQVLGQVIASMVLGFQIWREDWPQIKRAFSWNSVKRLAVTYKKFPIYNSWPSLLNSLTIQLPVLFLTFAYGSHVTGFFSLAMRMINTPLTLIGGAVSQVFLPELAKRMNKEGDVSLIIEKGLKNLFLLGGFLFVIMQFSPYVFRILFGEKWGDAGTYAQIMTVSVIMRFIVSPLSGVMITCNKQDTLAKWQVSYSLLTMTGLWFSMHFKSPIITLIILASNDFIMYSIYLYLILKASKASLRRCFRLRSNLN
jgi:O-antigen/teichoic acid export membrane protein